ncbi:hypothetical protein [Candidatus Mycobacterium methanotrophicum]|uniref:Secreted protein n=1 Tax=Candidatus Mycobacterium methanotrophicum TaxID=2943498 RepID=A0ABY4QK50_9MYCO|nr:hypothetical protein [Candidatus Mycobacterium methanotrophicum]UQX11397.1 hypothetical protein M5I08_02420 [Candidatus Mycobacterium methanotrophicum]
MWLPLATARADTPPDPHIPDPATGYCPGGGMGNMFEGYCDGAHYPDGTYWHRLLYGGWTFPWFSQDGGAPTQLGLSCVIDPDGGPIPHNLRRPADAATQSNKPDEDTNRS